MKKFNLKVKKEFRDRYTGLLRKPGEVMKDVPESRYTEIKRSGDYVEIIPDGKEAAPSATEGTKAEKK